MDNQIFKVLNFELQFLPALPRRQAGGSVILHNFGNKSSEDMKKQIFEAGSLALKAWYPDRREGFLRLKRQPKFSLGILAVNQKFVFSCSRPFIKCYQNSEAVHGRQVSCVLVILLPPPA